MKRLVVLAAILVLLPAPPSQAGETQAVEAQGITPPALASAASLAVTLITGDSVRVTPVPGARPAIQVAAATWPGRRVTFHTTYSGDRIRVVPSDVAHLVGRTLDPALFDVGALAEVGELRVIVRGGGSGAGKALPSIGATVQRLTTADAATVGARLSRNEGPQHIWLDAMAKAETATAKAESAAAKAETATAKAETATAKAETATAKAETATAKLDRNLTQIGAPHAWDRGLSGTAVKVAVLDTGVDPSHPDLRGRLVKAENFTDSPTADDRNGHGTHVASIVAGDGAAAGGQRRGVAFGSELLSGKVLGDEGTGSFSDIIEGMQWAADQGARIVNLSLGTDFPSNGSDPLSQAVESLTASHGTLFVVSAGNRGPGESTIGAPGAATSALTIGAVDAHDRLAAFSSRGPRVGDRAVKPELTAPGVDIIAARASGTDLGEPVNARYTRLSGTSMAAPHVAGAAALLAQHHPQWTGRELKALLVGSASPVKETAFAAGSGRLDLPKALRQNVIAADPTLSFGFVPYPPQPLAARPVTLVNKGSAAVTVDLSARMGGLGAAVRPAKVTIPAGGSAKADVSVAVERGDYGAFGGQVNAGELTVPLGVFKEPVHHFVHLRALDRLGTSRVETLAWLVNLDDIRLSPADPVLLTDGVATARVRPGHYTITAAIPTLEEGDPPPEDDDLIVTSVSIAAVADVTIDREREIVLNARNARPLSASVAGVATTPVDVHVFVAAKDRDDNGSVLAYQTSAQDVIEGKLFVEPTATARHGSLELSSKWRLNTVDGSTTYDLLFASGSFPSNLEYVADPGSLARIGTLYRAPVAYNEGRFAYTDVNPVSIAVLQQAPVSPAVRFEFISGGTQQSWFQCVNVIAAEEGIGGFCQAPQAFRRGETAHRDWLRAPLRTRAGAFREERRLFIGLDELADAAGTAGTISGHAFESRSYTLSRNGKLLSSGLDPLGGHPIPPGPATFTLTRSLQLRPGLLPLSPRVESSWTFTTPEGILDAEVRVPVDGTNTAAARTTLELVTARHATATLELSYDDGKTWAPVALQRFGSGRFRATVDLRPGAVSVRTAVRDGDGNHTEQTVIGAFLAG
ncbi:MAG TPA: S8 family serine peptidase [Candidatus Limnocylindrales bacterium]